jgi:hypothetical protein
MHTRQAIFDTVAKALIAQGKPAIVASGGMCLYRTHDGNKCGIGHLIPDAEYSDKIEGLGIDGILSNCLPIGPTVKAIANAVGEDFLMDLQGAHDNAAKEKDFRPSFKVRMRDVARKYTLDATCVRF